MKEERIDNLGQCLKADMSKGAERVEEEIRSTPGIKNVAAGDGLKEEIYNKIDAYEGERLIQKIGGDIYETYMLGVEAKKRQENETAEAETRKVRRKKKRLWKRITAVAAAAVMVCAIGITSIGGPERVVDVVREAFRSGAITKVNSGDESIMIDGDSETEAYEKIREVFNINPVVIKYRPEDMFYKSEDIDELMQTGTLSYGYNGQTVMYVINCSYTEVSFGVHVEDKVIGEYNLDLEETTIKIKKYETLDTQENRYVAFFEYKDIYYSLMGIMKQEEFEKILKNLIFF